MKVKGQKSERREEVDGWTMQGVLHMRGGGGLRWDDEEWSEMQRWRSEGRGSPSGRFICPHM